MMRTLLAALLLCALALPAQAAHRHHPYRHAAVVHRHYIAHHVVQRYVHVRHPWRQSVAWRHGSGRSSASLAGQPAPLIAKVQEIVRDCGSVVVSGYRANATINGHPSNHMLNRADDVAGNPSCIYAHLRGWPGGYSTDYAAVAHVHISYNPHSYEWDARFVHHGGGYHVRYAHRRHWRHAYGG